MAAASHVGSRLLASTISPADCAFEAVLPCALAFESKVHPTGLSIPTLLCPRHSTAPRILSGLRPAHGKVILEQPLPKINGDIDMDRRFPHFMSRPCLSSHHLIERGGGERNSICSNITPGACRQTLWLTLRRLQTCSTCRATVHGGIAQRKSVNISFCGFRRHCGNYTTACEIRPLDRWLH